MNYLQENDAFFDMFDVYWYDKSDASAQARRWESLALTGFGSDGTTITFSAFLPRNNTVKGVMVVKVRPSFDYTNIYLTDVSMTYFTNLYATKDFEYI